MRFLLFFILVLSITGCGKFKAEVDPVTGKKIRKEPDLIKRGDDFAEEQGGIFNSNRSSKGGSKTHIFDKIWSCRPQEKPI